MAGGVVSPLASVYHGPVAIGTSDIQSAEHSQFDVRSPSCRPLADRKIGNRKSLDHLVRPCEHLWRNRQADLLRGLQIDHELEFRRLLDGQVGRLGALENSVDVNWRRAGSSLRDPPRRYISPPASTDCLLCTSTVTDSLTQSRQSVFC